jgi:hypothetical protein
MSTFLSLFTASGWLGYFVALFAAGSMILAVPFVRRIAWTGVKLFPAAALLAIGVMAVPFWRSLSWAMTRTPLSVRVGGYFAGMIERFGRTSSNPLTLGKREEVARELWPEERYPFLYHDVPDDIVRPLWEDGRLIGGRGIPWLADRHFSKAMEETAGQVGLAAAILTFLLPPLVLILRLVFGSAAGNAASAGVVLEQFPHEDPVYVSNWSVWTTVIGDRFSQGFHTLVGAGGFMLAWALLSLGVGLLVAIAAVEFWRREKAAPYELISKDAHVRWPYRAESRALAQTAYIKQVGHATGYLQGSPLFVIGTGTGTLRVRGDLAAPVKGQTLALDGESLFQHLMVFGGTGDGKTTAILKPVLRQVLQQPNFGVYVTDAKGVLWRDAEEIANAAGRADDIVRIGTGDGEYGVNICEKLTPNQIAATLRSVLQQTSGGASDSFWPDMAANIMRHMLTIGRAYARTAKGEEDSKLVHPYSLWWAYQVVIDETKLTAALDALAAERAAIGATLQNNPDLKDTAAFAAQEERFLLLSSPEVEASHDYLTNAWAGMAKDTKTGIVASISQLMDGFAGARILRERFACGPSEKTTGLDAALNGKVVLVTLSTMEEGLPARLVAILLKTALYREARLREATMKASGGKPQDKPCLVMMDEVQEIVTVDSTSGLSDATFWNVARSTGLAGVFATQTVAALTQAMGKDAAENFLQQARSKVFLRSEDRETVGYACWCAGEFERNRVFDDGQWESLDQRRLVEGWTPFDEIDEAENPTLATQANLFFKAAGQLFADAPIGRATARRAYEADTRFVPSERDAAHLSAMQQATWRAESQERSYRTEGNTMAAAMTPADFIAMGRWHAYAHIQRAGVARQDIVELRHEY